MEGTREGVVAERTTLHSLVPLVQVHSVPRSIEFYAKLGFRVSSTQPREGDSEPVWAWLQAGGAHLMVSRTGESVDSGRQAVLFYLYTPDVDAFRTELIAKGVQAGVIECPFWAPRGEFRVEDPDGYVLMVTHT